MLPAQVVEHIIKLAVDPREVELAVEVGHSNFILHGKPMTRGASNNEPLRIQFGSLKWRGKAVWESHQRHIQLALRQQSQSWSGMPSSRVISIPGLSALKRLKKLTNCTGATVHMTPTERLAPSSLRKLGSWMA
jgi:hypothetical protein